MAAATGESFSAFLSSDGGGGASIDSLTSIANRTASFCAI
jgi:hypothetical protein